MSTTKLVTMICWIVVAVVIIGLAIWFLTGSLFGIKTGFKIDAPVINIGDFDDHTGSYNQVGSYTVSTEGIDSIDVNWVAGAATITPYDGDTIKITEFARRALKDNEKLVYETSGGKLEIKYISPGLTINMISKKLELLVPKALADKLDQLDVNATSAELEIHDFTVNSLEIRETSGTSDISNIKTQSADFTSVSGELEISNMSASTMSARTVSGEITLSAVTADSLTAKTTSGDQELGGAFNAIEASSVSGEISVASTVTPGKINIGTTSGDIVVTIPNNGDLAVSYSTTSGKFNSDIPVKTGGSAAYKFSSVSGDIWLKAA